MKTVIPYWPAAGLLLALFSLHVCAQEEAAEAPAELDEMVVTAALEPISARHVASSITIITRDEIEQRQVKYVADLLRDVPGFSVSQAGGAGAQTQVRVRGSEANHMLVLVDGIRANDAASADEFQWQYALASDVERIEIVRGPQSSIWGSDAVAGVVNIIRRRHNHEPQLFGRVEGGSFGTYDLATDGAWQAGGLRLRGGLSYFETDGTNISRQGSEKDGADNTTLDLGLEYDFAEAFELLLSGQHVDASSDFDAIDFFVTGLPVDADNVTEAGQSYWRGEMRWAPATSKWSANASVNYTDTDNQNFVDGAWNSSTGAETLEFRVRTSLELDGSERDQQHRFTVALDQIDTDFTQRGIASPFGDPNQDQSMDTTGLAGEYIGKLFEGFTWTMSGRHDDNSDFDDINTWQIAAGYRVNEHVKIRGSYGTGSKTPTFTERFGFFEDFFIGNPDLKPETSKGWELGMDSRWLDERIGLGIAYFDMELEDEINGFVFDPPTGAFTAENSDTPSDRKGWELTADARVLPGLNLVAGYTYTDATEPTFGGGTIREVRRPRHMASLAANYRFAQDRANLNLNVNYTGKQLDVFFDPATFIAKQAQLDSYTVLDLAGSWRLTEHLELVARVSNLTDQDYEEVLGFTRPGRAYFGGLRGRFGFR